MRPIRHWFVKSFSVAGPVREPTALRVGVVVSTALAVHGVILAVARGYRDAPLGLDAVVVVVAGAVVSGLLVGSIGEWLVHRYVMHRSSGIPLLQMVFDLHHRGHHWIHYTPERYVHAGPINYVPVFPPTPGHLCATSGSRVASMLAQLGFYLVIALVAVWLPAWLLCRNPLFTGVFALVGTVECVLFVRVHDLVHHPEVGWLRRWPGFEALDHHHYIHHLDTRANTNFLLPLGDVLFGTWRATVTAEEAARWPAFETARSTLHTPPARQGSVREA